MTGDLGARSRPCISSPHTVSRDVCWTRLTPKEPMPVPLPWWCPAAGHHFEVVVVEPRKSSRNGGKLGFLWCVSQTRTITTMILCFHEATLAAESIWRMHQEPVATPWAVPRAAHHSVPNKMASSVSPPMYYVFGFWGFLPAHRKPSNYTRNAYKWCTGLVMQRMQSSLRQSGEQPRAALGSRYMRGTASPASVAL